MSSNHTHVFERFDCTNGRAQHCYGCYTMTPDSEGDYVRASDAINREAVNQAEIMTLREQLKRLEDLIANPTLLGMHVEGNGLTIGLEGPGPLLFAQGFSDYFKKANGTNYVEIRMTSPDPAIGELLCTLQRLRGETPTQHRDAARRDAAEARAEIARLQPVLKFAGLVLKDHRNEGYPGDLDGAVVQQYAIDCELIAERQVTESCGANCSCAEVVAADDWADGIPCLFDTPLAQMAKDAAK